MSIHVYTHYEGWSPLVVKTWHCISILVSKLAMLISPAINQCPSKNTKLMSPHTCIHTILALRIDDMNISAACLPRAWKISYLPQVCYRKGCMSENLQADFLIEVWSWSSMLQMQASSPESQENFQEANLPSDFPILSKVGYRHLMLNSACLDVFS